MKKIIGILLIGMFLLAGCQGEKEVSNTNELDGFKSEMKIMGKITNLNETSSKFIVTIDKIKAENGDIIKIPYSVMVTEKEYKNLSVGDKYPMYIKFPTI